VTGQVADPLASGWPKAACGLLLSGFMSLVVSGISSFHALGWRAVADQPLASFSTWMAAYLPSWLVAFPLVTFAAPMARRIVVTLWRWRAGRTQI
jgi:hypothetical protein